MGRIDRELPFEIGPVNGRKVRESGLWLKASIAPELDITCATTPGIGAGFTDDHGTQAMMPSR